jgi:CHAD domain-containing protein
MAFQMRSDESVARGLRRLARKELRAAQEQLERSTPPQDEAIHEARKSLKKVRAIVELVDADDGRGLGGCRKLIRRVNRPLSRIRDADAMLEILAKLRDRNRSLFDEHTLARLKRRLASYRGESQDAVDDRWKRVIRDLSTLGRRSKRWHLRHHGFRALAAGIDATYRRGRKVLARAQRHQRADDFHEWRKQAKALWYQLRLLEPCSADIRDEVRTLDKIGDWLGDDHNVVVLCAELSKDTSICDIERLRRAANRFQCEARRKAVAAAARIYQRTPGEHLRRIERAWRAWRHAAPRRTRAGGTAA